MYYIHVLATIKGAHYRGYGRQLRLHERPPRIRNATLLPNSEVLIAGGATASVACVNGCGFPESAISSADVYNPAPGTFAATGNSMASVSAWATATLLPDEQGARTGGVPVS